jgi:chemotaxis response regulator CheB
MTSESVNERQVGVLIVDDAEVIRRTVTNFLAAEPAIKVLGEATNFKEAVSLASALKPDVILLDIHMSDYYALTPELIKNQLTLCGAKILAMSLFSDEHENNLDTEMLANSLGAIKLLDKSEFADVLIPTILGHR